MTDPTESPKPGWYLPRRPDGTISDAPIYWTADFPIAAGWTLGPAIADLLRTAAWAEHARHLLSPAQLALIDAKLARKPKSDG